MQFALGPYKVSISRTRSEDARPALDPQDVRRLNEPTLRNLSELTTTEMLSRVEGVVIDSLDNEDEYRQATELLADNGIVIIKNFFDVDTLDAVLPEIDRLLVEIDELSNKHEDIETDSLLFQKSGKRLKTYKELAEYSKPVATVRQGDDQGMIDVFNVDSLLGQRQKEIRKKFENPYLLKILNDYDENLTPANLNVYVNRGVTQTRGFHIDSLNRNLKGFVYIKDVVRLAQGPYCYVAGSHCDRAWRDINWQLAQLLPKRTDAPFVDLKRIIPVLARRGALVLSDQSGIHRGIPQGRDEERLVFVMRYK